MKHLLLGSISVLVFAQAAAASEFEFRGAEIIGTVYRVNPTPLVPLVPAPLPPGVDDHFTTASLGASVEFGLATNSDLIFQGDATFQYYDMPWQDFKLGSLGGHIGYDLGQGTKVGAFAVGELWDQNDEGEMILGAEVVGPDSGFTYEFYGAYAFDPMNGTDWQQYHYEANIGYATESGFGFDLGLHYTNGDLRFGLEGDMWQALANVTYAVTPDLKIEAGYIYTDYATPVWDSWEAHGLKLALTKTLGEGTSFNQRNYLSLHNGY